MAIVVLATVVGGCQTERGAEPHTRRLVILGFDGVDPRLLSRWMEEGKLPALRALSEHGDYRPLASTNPPQSPVAWTSFATGTGPARHGIFDFIERDPKTYLPDIGTGGVRPPRFWHDLIATAPAEGYTRRRGEPFWQIAATRGVRAVVLRVPYAFPPDPVPGGRMLSGLGVPDLLGTNSTFTFLAADLARDGGKRGDPGGGRLIPIALAGDEARIDVPGPPDPRGGGRPALRLPLTLRVDRAADAMTIGFAGREERVARGGWSSWFAFRLPVAAALGVPLSSIDGLCRFHVVSLDPVQVYLSPLNYAPAHPFAPISAPGGYAGEIAAALGPYKTVGWSEDTSALNAERIDEQAFLDDLGHTMDEVRASTLREIDRPDWDLLVSVFTQTDRVAHMFYRLLDPAHPRYDPVLAARFGDAVLRVYERMDAIVGEVRGRLGPETVLLVMSDHGFHSYRMGLNVNTWLREHGYLVQGAVPAGREDDDFFPAVDWSRTRAYALGTGQIYVNLRGREARGIVAPGAEYDRLLDAIARGLEAQLDPATGDRLIAKVYKGPETFAGAPPERMPDLQIAFRDGYRTSWRTPLGGIPKALFEPNLRKWSGDHAASDVADTPGVILSSRRLRDGDPAIVDLAPTALSFFDVPVPPEMQGRALLEATHR
ncbi:MAG TPA: alkaline phosphatase family protein [Candidatus Binatus sp.]|nr:alkaline phosphatase family protein [Candidatus Binatus sp.]